MPAGPWLQPMRAPPCRWPLFVRSDPSCPLLPCKTGIAMAKPDAFVWTSDPPRPLTLPGGRHQDKPYAGGLPNELLTAGAVLAQSSSERTSRRELDPGGWCDTVRNVFGRRRTLAGAVLAASLVLATGLTMSEGG